MQRFRAWINTWKPEEKHSYLWSGTLLLFFAHVQHQGSHISEYKKWADIKGDRSPTLVITWNSFLCTRSVKCIGVTSCGIMQDDRMNLQGPEELQRKLDQRNQVHWYEMRLGPQDNFLKAWRATKQEITLFFLLSFWASSDGFSFHRDKKDAWCMLLFFFFFTVLHRAITESDPLQPRERDYAYAGSTYAFAMWIGLGVLSLIEALRKKTGEGSLPELLVAVTAVCLLLVLALWRKPNGMIMTVRSAYIARLCNGLFEFSERNAIIFTNGDNDTFPLCMRRKLKTFAPMCVLLPESFEYRLVHWSAEKKYYDSDRLNFLAIWKIHAGPRDYVPFYIATWKILLSWKSSWILWAAMVRSRKRERTTVMRFNISRLGMWAYGGCRGCFK